MLVFQDLFKYNYPPLPDDDFQSPINENGLLVIDDDAESKTGEVESTSEIVPKPKKVHLSPVYVAAFGSSGTGSNKSCTYKFIFTIVHTV